MNKDYKSILISLEKKHANNIFKGDKNVEFRRRKMHINPGVTIWIYASLPVGAIIGKAEVLHKLEDTPSNLWQRFQSTSGLEENEFFEYFSGISIGTAISLHKVELLKVPIHLKALREIQEKFHPPQFFSWLNPDSKLLHLLSNSLNCNN